MLITRIGNAADENSCVNGMLCCIAFMFLVVVGAGGVGMGLFSSVVLTRWSAMLSSSFDFVLFLCVPYGNKKDHDKQKKRPSHTHTLTHARTHARTDRQTDGIFISTQ